jgi:multidrug resistance efflux pump
MHTKVILSATLAFALIACGEKKEEKTPAKNYKVDQIEQIIGVARIEPSEKISPLGAENGGKVLRICVEEGVVVKKGTVLCELDASTEQAQMRQTSAKLQTRQQKINSLNAKIQALEIKLQAADQERQRDQRLAQSNAGTQKQAFDSENTYNNLRADLLVAKADLAEAQAALNEVQMELSYTQTLSAKKQIVAPSDGMILNWDVKAGQTLPLGAKIADFAPAGGLIATTEVDELFAMKVKKGQRVQINVQGSTEKLTTGTVVYCAPFLSKKSIFNDRADNLEDRRVREVRVQIDNPDAVLIGSRVECIIGL